MRRQADPPLMAPFVLHSSCDFAQIYTALFVALQHHPESSVFAMSKDGVVQIVLLMLDVVFSVSPKISLLCRVVFRLRLETGCLGVLGTGADRTPRQRG